MKPSPWDRASLIDADGTLPRLSSTSALDVGPAHAPAVKEDVDVFGEVEPEVFCLVVRVNPSRGWKARLQGRRAGLAVVMGFGYGVEVDSVSPGICAGAACFDVVGPRVESFPDMESPVRLPDMRLSSLNAISFKLLSYSVPMVSRAPVSNIQASVVLAMSIL